MSPIDKPFVWVQGEVHSPPFSAEARQTVGYLLRLLQAGETLSMPVSRPMSVAIGSGCHELRIDDGETRRSWRIVYWIAEDAIFVLDVFEKRTQKTPDSVLKRCRQRLQRVQRDRREE